MVDFEVIYSLTKVLVGCVMTIENHVATTFNSEKRSYIKSFFMNKIVVSYEHIVP